MRQQWNKIYKDKLNKYNYYDLTKPDENLDKVLILFKDLNEKKALELDSGAGRNLIKLREAGFSVSGIDSSEAGIKITNEILESKNLSADLRVGDIFKPLPYLDNYFDLVISSHLNHATEADIIQTINEIKRVLKPNGLIFISLAFRLANGKIRPVIVKTAKKIAENTYMPTIGDETGLVHLIYNRKLIAKHYKDFQIIEEWRDSRDYFCFIAKLK